MAIDFSKFKSDKSEASVKTESHSQKSVTNSNKNDSVSSFDEVRKSDNESKTSSTRELSKDDKDTLDILQEETKKLDEISLDSINGKDDKKQSKVKNRSGKAAINTPENIVLNYANNFKNCRGDDGTADIFIKYVFGEDTPLHAGNKNKEDDVEGEPKTKENNGDENATPWCASFVSYVLENSGIDVPEWYNSIEQEKKALVNNVYVAAGDNNAIIEKSEVKPGDLIMLDRHNDGWYDHIAFVTAIDEDGTIHTLEGNAPEVSEIDENGVETWKDDQGIVTTKTYPPNYEEKNETTFAFARIN